MPNSSDNVVITLPETYTITINSDVSVGSLTLGASTGTQTLVSSRNLTIDSSSAVNANGVLNLSGTTVTLNSGLLVSGQLSRAGGSVVGTGILGIGSGANATIVGSTLNLDLSNQGTLVVMGTNTFSGSFTNAAGATLRLLADDGPSGTGSAVQQFCLQPDFSVYAMGHTHSPYLTRICLDQDY